VNLGKLTTGDRVTVGCGLALVVCSFLPWFGTGRLGVVGVTLNAWDFPLHGVLPTEIAAALVLVVLARRLAGATLLDLGSLRWGDVCFAGSALVCLLVLLKVLTGQGGDQFVPNFDREYGLMLAGIAAVGLVVGGWLQMRDDRPKVPRPSTGENGTGENGTGENKAGDAR
jgi:hypothetical protein